jgi:subtilase family serine protease
MRLFGRIAGAAIVVCATAAVLASVSPADAGTVTTLVAGTAATAGASASGVKQVKSCASAPAGSAHCLAIVRGGGITANAASPTGYGPADLRAAYKLAAASSTKGAGKTIAIVDAYDDPNAEADLAVYRSFYGLPPCTTANGCFRKVNQAGAASPLPVADGGWAEEISLDLDMASAICPLCKILLVEANNNTIVNLGKAVNRAVRLGATVVSNSYGGSDASDATYGTYFNHPGVAITVSSGDAGFGVEYPASSHYVTAVGGTSLVPAGNTRGWSETAWSGAGSGCSTLNAALTSAPSSLTGCGKRAVADVSAVADPNTGVSVYDSFAFQGFSGWLTFGGTSVAAPIIAGVFALAGNTASIANNYPYKHAAAFFDVISGSNGTCATKKLCTAGTGWDGPTGLGTPNGTGGF